MVSALFPHLRCLSRLWEQLFFSVAVEHKVLEYVLHMRMHINFWDLIRALFLLPEELFLNYLILQVDRHS